MAKKTHTKKGQSGAKPRTPRTPSSKAPKTPIPPSKPLGQTVNPGLATPFSIPPADQTHVVVPPEQPVTAPVSRRSGRNTGKQVSYAQPFPVNDSDDDYDDYQTPTTSRKRGSATLGAVAKQPPAKKTRASASKLPRSATKTSGYVSSDAFDTEYDVESDDELMSVASDDELLRVESDDEPFSEDPEEEPAKAAFQIPPGDKQRIREFLTQHVPSVQEQNAVDPTERILSALSLAQPFTSWSSTLLSMAASSVAKNSAQNLESFMDALKTRPPSLTPHPVGSFCEQDGDEWINDDDDITEEWNTSLCPDIQNLAGDEFDIKTLSKPSGRLDATLTVVLHYLEKVIAKGWAKSLATQKAGGWQNLQKGRATQEAGGWQSLQKGRPKSLATRKAGGWQSLQKGRPKSLATRKAGGWQSLQKGKATQKAGGWQSLQKGTAKSLATRKAGGWQSLEKGRATNKAGGWQSLQKGRAKSLATNKARGYLNCAKARAERSSAAAAKWTAKHTAFYNLKLVREALVDPSGPPGFRRWKHFRDALIRHQTLDLSRLKHLWAFFHKMEITFWSPDTPDGLRWDGDGCEEEDNFDHEHTYWPWQKYEDQIKA